MPRLTPERKKLNHDKIIEAAGRGFRTHGVNGIGIAELMKAAEMTHGGFYNHFGSKDELALEVIRQGFGSSLGDLAGIREEHPGSARAALDHIFDQYLAVEHRDHPEIGCASAALVTDVGREGVAAQSEYQHGLEGFFSVITEMVLENASQSGTHLDVEQAREQAIALFSQMVGALVVSRAVVRSSPALADEILKANNSRLKQA
ncbi:MULTISPECIES: TetR/AcrR family transcriptional regulator [Micromonospora]|uniref:TetR/AcrR family transcriptional regulator n=1 Tax=Micromonospora zamorensis TaxID=709883 RepID=A0ABZ1PF08_9ACTN|nr:MULTISPECIES: TetR/AcrR family transcriptional regulator [Micromonospora]MBQ0977466.1 TetR/AcrR family transcriptional regulator [Micromonospora sp. M61]MBQ1035866.1 TetR/AcrR family transcriptional regulator [Micromonospora sp. C81]WTI20474.1 TetR/AcrR family transcriptional regulator [Micromonospora zamorensis]